jgi:hypothetical protein
MPSTLAPATCDRISPMAASTRCRVTLIKIQQT